MIDVSSVFALLTFSPALWPEMGAGGAALITLLGIRLCWSSPRYRMSIEERAKDGAITEDQARRKIRFMGWFAPALTLAGCVMLGVLLSQL